MKHHSCSAKELVLRTTIFLCTIFSITGCKENKTQVNNTSGKWSEYVGRYSLKPDLVLNVKTDGELLTLLPSFWGSAQILDPIQKDSFVSLLHPRMQFKFNRDSTGKVISLTSSGNNEINGTAQKLPSGEYLAVELLLSGDSPAAIAKLKTNEEMINENRLVHLGFQLISNYPSRASSAVSFLSAFESKYPRSADLQQVIGLGSMLAKDRKRARSAFQKAFLIDPTDRLSQSVLRILDPENATPPPKEAWKLPFDLNKLFEIPSSTEITDVRRDWQGRDLSVKSVEKVEERSVKLDGCDYVLRIIKHDVQGRNHYGAVLIPKSATLGSSPVVLELHGVDSRYSPFKVRKAKMPKILRENREHVIIAIPSFQGNTLIVEEQSYISEGSAARAWDGAADDAIAFLNVVISTIPEVDSTRISTFGKSRGGTVAMLLGIRDKRIGCVINWAGPSGWFSHMGTFGFTLQEQVQWGLWERWSPGRGWGSASQFIDWFLRESIDTGKPKLSKIRHQILASSPIYFLNSLPVAQLQYGIEDGGVPIANAKALKKALEFRDKSAPVFELHMHENTGHDQPYPRAFELSRQFLHKQFFE